MTLLLFTVGALAYFAIGLFVAILFLGDPRSVGDEEFTEAVLMWPTIVCLAVSHILFFVLVRLTKAVARLARYVVRTLFRANH